MLVTSLIDMVVDLIALVLLLYLVCAVGAPQVLTRLRTRRYGSLGGRSGRASLELGSVRRAADGAVDGGADDAQAVDTEQLVTLLGNLSAELRAVQDGPNRPSESQARMRHDPGSVEAVPVWVREATSLESEGGGGQ